MTKNLAVFVSGRGSNLASIIEKIDSGRLDCNIKAVISDKVFCGAFEIADNRGIERYSLSPHAGANYIDYKNLIEKLLLIKIDLIVLAGFLKKIPDELINSFPQKIINIHPALLPAFGGKGMYGMNVHEAVFNKSCKVSGATVHFVDSIYDNGYIIAQETVDISNVKNPKEIAERVLKVEHELLPNTIKKIFEDQVIIENHRVRIVD
jgi:phosphoribosylglycinamide formyltransferase-1